MQDHSSVTLTPKLSFVLGLVGGILVICTVGFLIVLSMMLGDGLPSKSAKVAAPTAAVPTAPSAPAAAPVAGATPVITDADHIRGDVNAPVTIVEYSDFECPFCSRFHPTMMQVLDAYEGQVRWVYRHFPLSFHPEAEPSAIASECAAEQGKFWEYADALFANQTMLGSTLYTSLAADLGLNASSFADCMSTRKYASDVQADQASGVAEGVTGTPGTIIIGADGSTQLVPGAVPYAQIAAMIDAAL